MSNEIEFFNNLKLEKVQIEDISIGLRKIGKGDVFVFIHGFPTSGYTWRKLLPELSKHFKCYVLDLPGLGDSEWTNRTDFKSESQARFIIKLLKILGVERYSLIAQDSGATIARYIAINQKEKIENLILFNTEIPNHRPPWIPFYQTIGLLPGIPFVIRFLLRQEWFLTSSMGFREFYSDKKLLYKTCNIKPYLSQIVQSQDEAIGALKYLKGIDWNLVDEFENLHKFIVARTLFIWGEDDRTFPIRLAKQMINQFHFAVEFITIKHASLLPHEEMPEQVIEAILNFTNPKT